MFMNRYNGIDKVWTVEMIDRLREHRAAGLSATVTAERISGEFVPVTRNAVCGKIHRLGLSAPMVKRAKVEKPKKPRTRELCRRRVRRAWLHRNSCRRQR